MTKIESGRSMVEMLGVLAIIGVLSIGGIAGYTMAMNRYRANEIIDTASKLSVVAQTQTANGLALMQQPLTWKALVFLPIMFTMRHLRLRPMVKLLWAVR